MRSQWDHYREVGAHTHIMQSQRGCTSYAHRSKWSFWAKSCQSLPLALAVSKVAQILWRMDRGILKALGPVWDVMVQSVCIKNGTDSFSVWRNRTETGYNQTEFKQDLQMSLVLFLSSLESQMDGVYWVRTIQTGMFNILKHPHRVCKQIRRRWRHLVASVFSLKQYLCFDNQIPKLEDLNVAFNSWSVFLSAVVSFNSDQLQWIPTVTGWCVNIENLPLPLPLVTTALSQCIHWPSYSLVWISCYWSVLCCHTVDSK